MNKTVTLSVAAVMCALIIIVAGIVVKQKDNQPETGNRQDHETIETIMKTALLPNSEETPDSLSEFMETYEAGIDDFYSKTINWNDFSNIIARSEDIPDYRKFRILNLLRNEMFNNGEGYTITNLLDIALQKRLKYGLSKSGSSYSSVFVALRYKNLIPYMTEKLLTAERLTNINDAAWCVTWFGYINHPDKIKTFLLLDKEIPENSPLRTQSTPLWPDVPSCVYRPDCLELYLDISSNPQQWKFHTWHRASLILAQFTNDTAVIGLNNAYHTLKKSKNFWGKRHDTGMNVYLFEKTMKNQRDRISGKLPVMAEPPPLLDE